MAKTYGRKIPILDLRHAYIQEVLFLCFCINYRVFKTFSWPQLAISFKIGLRLCPSSVKEYSTRGGISLNCWRLIRPSASSSFSCSLKTFRDIEGILAAISPKRRVWSERRKRMIDFHLPPIKPIVVVKGQGLFSTLFSISHI